MIEVLAETGTDRALLDDRERRRQGAGPQQNGKIVGRLNGEIAGNLPRAAEDGLADHRRRDDLVVEHDGERLADILPGRLGEFACAARVEAEADDRFVVALVEARLGVDQIGAGHQYALFDDVFLAAFAVEYLGIRRRVGRDRLFGRLRLIDHAEIELRRLAEYVLEPRRILQSRDLDEDAIGAFALDGRLDQSELVDAPLDDLNRLIYGLADALVDRRVRRRERDQAAVLGDIDAALARGSQYAGQRLRQFAQFGDGVIHVALAGDADFDAVAVDGAAGKGDAILPQNPQHVVGDTLQPLFADGGGIDFEEQARTALEIETENDVALRP